MQWLSLAAQLAASEMHSTAPGHWIRKRILQKRGERERGERREERGERREERRKRAQKDSATALAIANVNIHMKRWASTDQWQYRQRAGLLAVLSPALLLHRPHDETRHMDTAGRHGTSPSYIRRHIRLIHQAHASATPNPTWGDIFESSKLKARTSLLARFSENRRSSFEL